MTLNHQIQTVVFNTLKPLIYFYAYDPCSVLSNVLLEHHESEHTELDLSSATMPQYSSCTDLSYKQISPWGLCVLQILHDHDIYVRI